MTEKQEKRRNNLHLEFAERVYKSTFDESLMSEDEIKHMKNQIPIIGRPPFYTGYEAALKDSQVLIEALKNIRDDYSLPTDIDNLTKCDLLSDLQDCHSSAKNALKEFLGEEE